MKKEKIFFLITIIILVIEIIGVTFPKKEVNEVIKSNKQKVDNSSLLSIMLETDNGSGKYTQSNSSTWPTGDYILNETLSKCANGSTISYNTSSRVVSVYASTSDKCYVYFDIDAGPSTITLKKLGLKKTSNETPDFSKITVAGETGIYAMDDDLGISYYFRGDARNNYVKFAGFYWRIIRINGDGTIRMIYDGDQAYGPGEGSSNRVLPLSYYNSSYNDNAYVGYMHGDIDNLDAADINYDTTHANDIDSNVKKRVDKWYENNLYNTRYENLIADAIYCNDRSIVAGTGYGKAETTYSYFESSANLKRDIRLTCPQKNDRFTKELAIGSVETNGDLKYPIGMITIDEMFLAGGILGRTANTTNYLYTGLGIWTMTPVMHTGGGAQVYQTYYWASPPGQLYYDSVMAQEHIQPVISIKSDVSVSGNGTSDNPFIFE